MVGITGSLLLSWSLLLSQAMESVTLAFYSRSDLDLILTSPACARKVFAVRMGRIAGAAVAIAVLLAAPFINVLAVLGGSRWLAALWRRRRHGRGRDRRSARTDHCAISDYRSQAHTAGRTDSGGGHRRRFVIGLQIAAIFSAGSLSRFAALQSDWMLAHAPLPGCRSPVRTLPILSRPRRSLRVESFGPK